MHTDMNTNSFQPGPFSSERETTRKTWFWRVLGFSSFVQKRYTPTNEIHSDAEGQPPPSFARIDARTIPFLGFFITPTARCGSEKNLEDQTSNVRGVSCASCRVIRSIRMRLRALVSLETRGNSTLGCDAVTLFLPPLTQIMCPR